jgi:phage tail sheath protein FI
MPNYYTPGVYVEEIPSGARPIQAVGTSTAAFLGAAPDPESAKGEPTAINNWSQFVRTFAPKGGPGTPLTHAVFGFYQNGGGRCYVVNTGKDLSVAKAVEALEREEEVKIVAAPGAVDPASYEALLSHCEKMKDRVAILDGPETVRNVEQLTRVAASGGKGAAPADPAAKSAGLRPRKTDGGYGAFYFPWISVRDALSPRGELVSAPPSGHLAGIYARTDATRGVHKAPANEPLRGALDVTYAVTQEEQGVLNPNGVNCIRFFASEGIRVWGARTLADAASEWRYLNVRRLFNMIEESIARSTRWVVFEPNDASLWKAIVRDVGAFLTLLWRQGALMGGTPEEAFFVQCDEETNPPEVIDAGQVVTVIGVAPVKPAEFVIFRIGQGAGGAKVETEGESKKTE